MTTDNLMHRDQGFAPRVDAAVSLRGVTRLFDGLPAISHITLDLGVGETVWLRGSNGSGKSTLLRVVATALSPTYGSGMIFGHDLRTGRARIRQHIDLLGHRSRLYEDLTAVENLRFVCSMHDVDRGRIDPALERVGLDEVAHIRTAASPRACANVSPSRAASCAARTWSCSMSRMPGWTPTPESSSTTCWRTRAGVGGRSCSPATRLLHHTWSTAASPSTAVG